MDDIGGQLSEPESPGSSSSTNNQLRTLAKETPRIINIPFKMILNFMLAELRVSPPEYHLELCEKNEVRVTILFNTSTFRTADSPTYFTVSGIKSTSYQTIEDSACQKAITYVEEATNTVIRDLSYERLLEIKLQNKCLLRKLIQAHEYKKQLARGWFLAVRHMFPFSQQILNVVQLNYTDEEDYDATAWNKLLANFQDLACRPKHAGSVLEKRVEEMRNDYFS